MTGFGRMLVFREATAIRDLTRGDCCADGGIAIGEAGFMSVGPAYASWKTDARAEKEYGSLKQGEIRNHVECDDRYTCI